MIAPATNYVDLNLNFNVDYSLATRPEPGLFNQSLSFVGFSVSSPYSPVKSLGGSADSITAHKSHGFSNNGIFTGFPEKGGSTIAALPIRIPASNLTNSRNLNELGELLLPFNIGARVSGLALSDGYASGSITVGIPSFSSFVTTQNGTPINNFGVNYSVMPGPSNTPDSTAVPTPALLPGLVGVALSAIRKRHREQVEDA